MIYQIKIAIQAKTILKMTVLAVLLLIKMALAIKIIKILKITYLTFLFLSLSLKASAPVTKQLTIISTEPIEPYRQLISAIGSVETMHDTLAYNPVEQAVGYFLGHEFSCSFDDINLTAYAFIV